jgi:predicted permease
MTWWGRLLRRGRLDGQLDAELRDHLDRLTADYVQAGLAEDEARHRARLAFGGLDQVKEACRDVRGTRWLEEIAQDLRYGLRMLRLSPAFTLVAVASLALGIGANSAIFGLVDSVLLKSLPVREPDRLVLLDDGSWTNPIWEQIRDREAQLFQGAAAWSEIRFDLSGGGPTEFVEGLWVSGEFFDVLGVPAIAGRTFTARDDARDGGPDGPVAVISYAFWQRYFGGAEDAIGRPLTLDRISFTVVGVTPPAFFGPAVGRSFDVAVPLGTQAIVRGPQSWLDQRSTWVLEIMGRLKPGQTADAATRALRDLQPQIRAATTPMDWPAGMAGEYLRDGLTLVPAAAGPSGLRTRYAQPLLVLMAVVGLVLLIACANIANLLLARAAGRRHELSMRLALGATRARLVRQLLVESLLLAGIGAAVGLLLAQWGSHLLVSQLSTPRSTVALDLGLDWRIVAFTAGIAVATAVLFGMAPAVRARHVEPHDALKEQGRSLAGGSVRSPGGPLLVVQVAFSLVLVVAAGLFMRTFATLATLDLGFERDPVLVVDVDASRSRVPAAQRTALFARVREAAAAVPGVARAGFSRITPVSGSGWNGPVELAGRPDLTERERMTFFNSVTPGWFATYGTSLRAGRDFDERDTAGAAAVGIANETFVRKFLQGADPIGATVRYRRGPGDGPPVVRIVGVVQDAAYRSVRDPVPPVLYFPVAQAHAEETPAALSLSVRAAGGSPALLTRSLTDALALVDRDLSLTFRPLASYVNGALVRERMLAMLSGFFGALALLLAGIGLYGMSAHAVSRRRTEIGIRMALGADRGGVVRLVLRRVAAPVGLGLVAGAALSFWASRFVATLVYGLEPRDPATFAGAALVLAGTAVLAAWLPARRAARIDPARVLREG